jgi:hypothetical protein
VIFARRSSWWIAAGAVVIAPTVVVFGWQASWLGWLGWPS